MGKVRKRDKDVGGHPKRKYPPTDHAVVDEEIIKPNVDAALNKIYNHIAGVAGESGRYDNVYQIVEDHLHAALDDYWGMLEHRVKIKKEFVKFGAAEMNEGRR